MNRPNTNFNLSVEDLELIESGLLELDQTEQIRKLLAKLHHQKIWYRKTKDDTPYISG